MRVSRQLMQRIVGVFTVIAIAFATGFVLQESELLGPSPSLPGRVPLEAVATGKADASFTSGRHGAAGLSGAVILSQ